MLDGIAADRKLAAESAQKRDTSEGIPRFPERGTREGGTTDIVRLSGGKWQSVGESNPSFQVENLAS